jgi:hypothetical protein
MYVFIACFAGESTSPPGGHDLGQQQPEITDAGRLKHSRVLHQHGLSAALK